MILTTLPSSCSSIRSSCSAFISQYLWGVEASSRLSSTSIASSPATSTTTVAAAFFAPPLPLPLAGLLGFRLVGDADGLLGPASAASSSSASAVSTSSSSSCSAAASSSAVTLVVGPPFAGRPRFLGAAPSPSTADTFFAGRPRFFGGSGASSSSSSFSSAVTALAGATALLACRRCWDESVSETLRRKGIVKRTRGLRGCCFGCLRSSLLRGGCFLRRRRNVGWSGDGRATSTSSCGGGLDLAPSTRRHCCWRLSCRSSFRGRRLRFGACFLRWHYCCGVCASDAMDLEKAGDVRKEGCDRERR